MSTHEIKHVQEKTSPWPLLVTLGGIAMLSGLLVVLAYQITRPMIEANQRAAIAAAIAKVIPGAVSNRAFVLTESGLRPAKKGERGDIIYAGYNKNGKLAGVAARAAAQGYADMIYMLYGYDPKCQCIRGIRVLKMTETPGLGDRIKTDPDFLKNFQALDATLAEDGKGLENPIHTVKHGKKRNPWEIDAISGATISSRAVGRALNASAQRLLPMLLPHLDELKKAAPKTAKEARP